MYKKYLIGGFQMNCINLLASKCLILMCLLLLAISALIPNSSKAAELSDLMINIGTLEIDPKVSINEITDHPEYIKLKGTSPNKISGYRLAEILQRSKKLSVYNFEDAIPFWEKEQLTIFLKKKNVKKENQPFYVEINSPLIREELKNPISLKGSCSRDGGEVVILGDINQKTICSKGQWELSLQNPPKWDLPIIGISAHQIMINQDMIKDYRSFIVK